MTHSKSKLSGIRLMIQGSVAFSLMALCVKLASQTLPSLEIVFFRSLLGTLIIGALIFRKKVSFFGHTQKKAMIWRGITGFIALSLHFYTIAHLPIGTAVLLNYTSPIFSALLAMLVLREKKDGVLLSLIALCFGGVYLLVGEPHLAALNFYFILGLVSAIFAALAYILIRVVKHQESPLTVIFYFTGISTLGSVFFLPFGFQWPNMTEWLLLIGVGIGSFYGQLWMTIALRRAPASLVSPFMYVSPILSFFYGFLLFGDYLGVQALTGVLVIIGSGVFISYRGTKKPRAKIGAGLITHSDNS